MGSDLKTVMSVTTKTSDKRWVRTMYMHVVHVSRSFSWSDVPNDTTLSQRKTHSDTHRERKNQLGKLYPVINSDNVTYFKGP